MHGQIGIMRAHRAHGDVVRDASAQTTVELAVHERVDEAAIAEMVDAQHVQGNPLVTRLLPVE